VTTTAPQLALPSGERRADPSITVYGVLALTVFWLVVLGTLAGAYVALRAGTPVWPPKGVTLQEYFDNTLLITAFIGAIGGWWGLYGVLRGERRQAIVGLALSVLMDGAFINLLTYVVRVSHLSPRQGAYAVLWYALVVAVGAIFATGIGVAGVALARVAGGQVTAADPTLAWCAGWYGTLVALSWVVMYYLVHVVQ
jgi:heme/copper-type cytochrome/quinol oxidase subunit 3